MKDALVIPADAPPYKAEIPDDRELEELQRLVGGWVEYVPVLGEDGNPLLSLFCNEEGKIEDLPPNGRANHLFGGALNEGDYLVGGVVLMGPPDDKGDTLPLDYADQWLMKALDITDVDIKRWADWEDLRARQANASTPEELELLKVEEEELRERGIREVMNKDLSQTERWWWLSFADPNKPEGEQFLGVIITLAGGIGEATQKLWDMGINPGGEVKAYPYPDDVEPPPEHCRNKLLSKADLEEAGLI